MKVYIVNKGHHNYSGAEKWGELAFLSEDRSSNIFATDNLIATIEKGLEQATAEDYLLPSGHIIPNAVAIHAMIKKHGQAKLLVWIGNKGVYQAITLK